MAVYTTVHKGDLEAFLEGYDLGTLERYEGIPQGVSNSNYHLFTSKGRYILTLFEPRRVDAKHVPFFLAYAEHMNESGVPCARAVRNNEGAFCGTLSERTAAIMTFLDGEHPHEVTPALCREAGVLTARMHEAGKRFELKSENAFGPERWMQWQKYLADNLNEISFGLSEAVKWEIEQISCGWPSGLPRGAIHADLFPDNVFFKDGKVSGVIDFHFACTDFLAYDLAIVINAWCFDAQSAFVQARYDELMQGYESVRPLNEAEKRHMPMLLRGAALRFLLSRCDELLSHHSDDLAKPHDPIAFAKRLEHFQGE